MICVYCGREIEGDNFSPIESKPLCEKCYEDTPDEYIEYLKELDKEGN